MVSVAAKVFLVNKVWIVTYPLIHKLQIAAASSLVFSALQIGPSFPLAVIATALYVTANFVMSVGTHLNRGSNDW